MNDTMSYHTAESCATCHIMQAVRDQVYSEVQGELHATRTQLESAKQQLQAADAQVMILPILCLAICVLAAVRLCSVG